MNAPTTTTLDCGHAPTVFARPNHSPAWETSHAIVNGRTTCENCIADMERARARAGEPITAYLREIPDSNRYEIVTWSGVALGTAYVKSRYRVTNSFMGTHMECVSGAIEGRAYYGRGWGANMVINLRAKKCQS